jgi:MFS family permease
MVEEKSFARDFWKIFLLIFSTNTLTTILGAIAVEMVPQTALNSVEEIGLINSIFLITAGLTSFVWAYIADKTERKKLLAICCGIWTTATFLTVFTNDFIGLLIAQMLTAVGYGGVLPISFSLNLDLTATEKRAQSFTILQVGITLGNGLGLLLPGVLVDFLPWWVAFLIFSILGLITFLRILSIKEPERGALEGFAEGVSYKIKLEDFKEIVKIKSNLLMFGYVVTKIIAVGAINFYFITFLEIDHQFSSSLASISMILIFSSQLSAPIFGRFADKQYEKRKTAKVEMIFVIIVVGSILYIIGFSLDFTIADIVMVVVFYLFIVGAAFIFSADGPIGQSIYGDLNPPQYRSTLYSISYIFDTMGQSLGVILLGIFYIGFGTYRMAFVSVGIILILSSIFMIPLRKTVLKDLEYLESKYKKKEK